MVRLPDLVRDSKLETRSTQDGETVHVFQNPSRHRGATETERWRYKGLIGSGGGGVVTLEEKVSGSAGTSPSTRAVKAIRVHEARQAKSSNHESIAGEYVRELEALAKFSQRKYSSCFVQFYGWWERTQRPQYLLIAMEYCPLGDLDSYISSHGPVPVDQAQEIAAQVLDGLCYMHEEGFAHRDLKPANILIKSHPPAHWWVVICDHGLSKRVEDNPAVTTLLRGTPMFMSPERHGFYDDIVPEKADPYATDMWCLGETTFQMLCDEPTFGSGDKLRQYARDLVDFPTDSLRRVMVDEQAIDFLMLVMRSHPTRRLTCLEAREHVWMKLNGKQQPRNSIDLQQQEQALVVGMPVHQPTATSGTDTESYLAWSTVSQASEQNVSKDSAYTTPNFEALTDFSLDNFPTTSPTVKGAATGPESSTATITKFNETTENGQNNNVMPLLGAVQPKEIETANMSPRASSKSNDGLSTAHKPKEDPPQNPEKKPQEAPKKRSTRKMLRQLFGLRTSNGDILNQPSPFKSTALTSDLDIALNGTSAPQRYEVLPGGRIARMSALDAPSNDVTVDAEKSSPSDTHTADSKLATVAPLKYPKKTATVPFSPGPDTQGAEQLPFFKDYYSQDDIRPGDKVSVLWAYQPRAADEFTLDRGDMVHVTAVWDDGWGVGALLKERAEDWDMQRDGSSVSEPLPGESILKAFPLVCVCLPQHWRKTIEGEPPQT
ncbi:kinase-like domain-containing protein [Dactylonectria estremocensis]|uniref:non-specific serine/threonine protein kinase n=1 Tax=Dactylonectria estremocensis TaxID=1079267 RepID=A0A9P9D7Y9_9HYPO|nr:kinase-like domain-containing protein [Dactylonectria estremocensis]